jgi:hypothetical protein
LRLPVRDDAWLLAAASSVSGGAVGGADDEDNLVAVLAEALIVEVGEAAGPALVELCLVVDGKQIIITDGEAAGVDGILLDGVVELELVVGNAAETESVHV